MMARPAARSTFRIQAPAFRLQRGHKPVFLNRNRLFCLGSRGGAIYDITERKKVASIKTCSHALEIAISVTGNWIATKNSSGEIVVSQISDGTVIHKYARPPYQESGQLAACEDGEHFLDSTDGVIHLHNAKKGAIIRSYRYGDDGWMPKGVAFAKGLGQFLAGVTPKRAWFRRNVSFIHFFDFKEASRPAATIKLPGTMNRIKLAPNGRRLAAVFDTNELERLEVRALNMAGEVIASRKFPGRSVYYGSPVWTPDGKSIVIIIDQAQVVFLNAETLQTEREYRGPSLSGIAFQPEGDLVALVGDSGFGGIVLPESQVETWSELEGEPRSKKLADQFSAYTLQIDLRKACPPRAAVFKCSRRLIFESERLVGYFRYLPGKVVANLDMRDRPERLGGALRKTLAEFEDSPTANKAVPGPAFPGECDRLVEGGLAAGRVQNVRYLGHEVAYAIDHSDVDVMISVIEFEHRLHFWLCRSTDDGKFYETYWPHKHLADSASDEELGNALLTALASFPHDTRILE